MKPTDLEFRVNDAFRAFGALPAAEKLAVAMYVFAFGMIVGQRAPLAGCLFYIAAMAFLAGWLLRSGE